VNDEPRQGAETLYQHAGGDQGLHRLEALFYEKVLSDPVLKTLSDEELHPIRAVPHWEWSPTPS